jgi:hypothetical protein
MKRRISTRRKEKIERIRLNRKPKPFTACIECRGYVYYNCCCYRCMECDTWLAEDDSWECQGSSCKYINSDWEEPREGSCHHNDYPKRRYACSECKCLSKPIKNETTEHTLNKAQIDAWLESETPTEQVDIPDRYEAIMQGLVNPYESAYLKKVAD